MLRAGKLDVELDSQLRARRIVASDSPQFAGTQNGEPVSLFADEISTLLTPDGWTDRIIAAGHARFLTKNATAENCLDAGRIELESTPRTNQPHRMTAVENVIVQSDLPGGISRHMATTSLVVEFAPDESGGGVHATSATTPAAIVDWLSPTQVSGKTGVQRVHLASNQLDARFAEGKELRDLHGTGGVQVDRQIGDGVPVTSASRELVAQFAPGGEWSTIEQTGDVRLRDADKTAESARAHFDHSTETATLTGGVVLTDASSRTTAQSGKFVQDVDEFQADGGVLTSEISAGTGPGANGASGPAHISADHLNVDTQTGHATYSGNARLWQHDSLVQADTVELDHNAQTLTATGSVHAIFPQVSRTPTPGVPAAQVAAGKPDLVRAEAGRMTYESALHRVRLERGATAREQQGTLRSTSMDLFFVSEDGRTKPVAASPTASPLNVVGGQSLDRVIALGDVVIDQNDRHAKASRADYTAADGKFVLSGGPPTVYDATGNATTGRQLTFVFADDRIVVDSEEGSRTVTMHPVEK
jgi:lipopolysaccharide transport protein LptA